MTITNDICPIKELHARLGSIIYLIRHSLSRWIPRVWHRNYKFTAHLLCLGHVFVGSMSQLACFSAPLYCQFAFTYSEIFTHGNACTWMFPADHNKHGATGALMNLGFDQWQLQIYSELIQEKIALHMFYANVMSGCEWECCSSNFFFFWVRVKITSFRFDRREIKSQHKWREMHLYTQRTNH